MSHSMRFAAMLFAFALMIATACNKNQDMPSPESVVPAATNFGPAPTEEESRQFARDLERAVKDRDVEQMEKLLRIRDLMSRCISDIGLSEQERNNALKGAEKAIINGTLSRQILAEIEKGGTYKFLRIHEVDGRQRVLFRLIGSEGALNYHDFLLARYPDGVIAMEDIHIAVSAEMVSQTVRRILIPAFSQLKAGKGLTGADREYVDNMPTIAAMGRANRERRFAEAAAQYRKLPNSLQENKSILLIYLQACMQMSDTNEAEYLGAMNRFRSLFPNDPCTDLVSIDYYIIKKKYAEALQAIDRIEKAIGGDPYIHCIRANLLLENQRFDDARKQIDLALKAEPDLKNAHWARITVALREKKHADALEALKTIVQVCKIEISDLSTVPEYAEFVKSPQHGQWQEWYQKNKK